MQRPMNYIELRTLVRSGSLSIDLNSNAFFHPFYAHCSIHELDNKLKERAFGYCFNKISDFSFNPAFKEELQNKTDIEAHILLTPSRDYLPTAGCKTKLEYYLNRIRNYMYHQPKIVIKPNTLVFVPLVVRLIEGKVVPIIRFKIAPELAKLGLVAGEVFPTEKGTDNQTFVGIFNSSNRRIPIEDLSSIGTLQIVQV